MVQPIVDISMIHVLVVDAEQDVILIQWLVHHHHVQEDKIILHVAVAVIFIITYIHIIVITIIIS